MVPKTNPGAEPMRKENARPTPLLLRPKEAALALGISYATL